MAAPAVSGRLDLMNALADIIAGATLAGSAGIQAAVLTVAIAVLLVWWFREDRLGRQRRVMRQLYRLGEQMAAGWPAPDSLKILRDVLPEALRITDIRLYLHDRAAESLRSAEDDATAGAAVISPDHPDGPLETVVAACFRNRSLLIVPDTRKSPLVSSACDSGQPRFAVCVPMFAQTDLVGILLLTHATRARHFTLDERAVAQHLANQTAIGLKLRERQTIREQLLRNERLAATGQLISSIAAELKGPLDTISLSAGQLAASDAAGAIGPELREISSAARRALKIVAQLLSFARPEPALEASVNLTSLLRSLVTARARSLQERGIQLEDLLPDEPVLAGGSTGHLHQVFLSLLVHAENASSSSPEKKMSIRAGRLADTISVEIAHSGSDVAEDQGDPETGAFSLEICRGILRNHDGELRVAGGAGNRRFEVGLAADPRLATFPAGVPALKKTRQTLTTLVVDPEPSTQRRLIVLLGQRGHRSVPVASAEEAADLVRRAPFHAMFCSARLPGENCLELFEQTRARVKTFVLLAETRTSAGDPDILATGADFVLTKPVDPEEFSRVLDAVESRMVEAPR